MFLIQKDLLTFNTMKAIAETLKRRDLASHLTQAASASAAPFASSGEETASSSEDEDPRP